MHGLHDTACTQANCTGNTEVLHCSVQAYEHGKQLQAEHARLALLELETAAQQGVASPSNTQQLPRKRRPLHTSQNRLIKVVTMNPGSVASQLFACSILTTICMDCSSCTRQRCCWTLSLLIFPLRSNPCMCSLLLGLPPPDPLSCTAWPFQQPQVLY